MMYKKSTIDDLIYTIEEYSGIGSKEVVANVIAEKIQS